MSAPSPRCAAPPLLNQRLNNKKLFFFFFNSGASLIQLPLCSNQLQHVSGLRWVPDSFPSLRVRPVHRERGPSTARRPMIDRPRLIDNPMITTIKTNLNRKMSFNRSVTVNLRPLIRTVQGVDGDRLQPDARCFLCARVQRYLNSV